MAQVKDALEIAYIQLAPVACHMAGEICSRADKDVLDAADLRTMRPYKHSQYPGPFSIQSLQCLSPSGRLILHFPGLLNKWFLSRFGNLYQVSGGCSGRIPARSAMVRLTPGDTSSSIEDRKRSKTTDSKGFTAYWWLQATKELCTADDKCSNKRYAHVVICGVATTSVSPSSGVLS